MSYKQKLKWPILLRKLKYQYKYLPKCIVTIFKLVSEYHLSSPNLSDHHHFLHVCPSLLKDETVNFFSISFLFQ